MEKNEIANIVIDGSQTVLCTELFHEPRRLTPTGKISHAKTRVYTQRYRKEWEQMPDFKGWLTSVPTQATRAFCTYCKKNLHAHRLSLLKHTCTMKHQRAALMYQAEMNEKNINEDNNDEKLIDFNSEYEHVNVQTVKSTDTDEDSEVGENDFDYVVERLEMEEEDNCDDVKNQDIHLHHDVGNDNDDDDDNDNNNDDDDVEHDEGNDDEDDDNDNAHDAHNESEEFQLKLECSGNDSDLPCSKKMKLDTNERRDTLAEAMAHVHGEYLDSVNDNQHDQLGMIVETVDHELSQNCNNNSDSSNHSNSNNNNSNNNDSNSNNNNSICNIKDESDINELEHVQEHNEKSLQDIEQDSTQISNETNSVAYQVNTPQLSSTGGCLMKLSGGSPSPALTIASMQNRTLVLSSGKTVTLTQAKLPAGYILSKVKGNLPAFVTSGSNKISNHRPILPKSQLILPTQLRSQNELTNDNIVAGPSQNIEKKVGMIKNIPITSARISTHVLDTSKGVPVGGLQVSLYKLMNGRWTFLNESVTSPSGRCTDLVDMKKSQITAGRYKIHFDVDKYFTLRRIETMYPFIEIVFDVKNPTGNYHIPILLSPFSYTTYRGTDR